MGGVSGLKDFLPSRNNGLARPSCTVSGVNQAMPWWRCSVFYPGEN